MIRYLHCGSLVKPRRETSKDRRRLLFVADEAISDVANPPTLVSIHVTQTNQTGRGTTLEHSDRQV